MFDKQLTFLFLCLFIGVSLLLSWRQYSLLHQTDVPWVTTGFTEPENKNITSFFVTNNNTAPATLEYVISQKDTPEEKENLTLAPKETRILTPQNLQDAAPFTILIKNPYHEPLTLSRKY
jgi:hypothetical protein